MAKTPSRPKRPADLKFSETHEWVRVDGAEAVVGISDYAVSQLSDLVSIELPKVGTVIEVETPMGEVESVKTVAELVSPVSGKISAANKDVVDNVDLLAESLKAVASRAAQRGVIASMKTGPLPERHCATASVTAASSIAERSPRAAGRAVRPGERTRTAPRASRWTGRCGAPCRQPWPRA